MQSSDTSKAKSIFASKTFWGVAFATVSAIVPLALEANQRQKWSLEDSLKVVLVLAGSGTAIVGRVSAEGPVWTPGVLPGPNKDDFETEGPQSER